MKKGLNSIVFLGISFVYALPTAAQATKTSNKKPNILFLLTDDQSYNTIHALGNKNIVTPNMDLLVKNGTTFTQTHVMGGLQGAISMPSRAMLLTGKYLHNLQDDGSIIPEAHKTFPQLLGENGYTTFSTGKWHSDRASFNRSFSTGDNIFFGGMLQYNTDGHFRPFLHAYDKTGKYQKGYFREKFSSVCYADAVIDFMKRQKDEKKPFLAYVAFNSPHDPRTPPPAYGHKYNQDNISLPINFMTQHPFNNGDMDVRDEVYLPIPRDPDAVKKEIAAYYGMVSEVDTQIGRIIEALKETGEYENTIIIFTSDNGLAVGQHGLLGKQNLYEHSVKTPLIISGPGIPKSEKNDAYCYLLDIYPTLCELIGLNIPESVDGRSLKTAITTKEPIGRKQLLLSYINIQRAVKKDNFKLIVYNIDGQRRIQLFDLASDPMEINNLADAPAYKEKVEKMYQALASEMRERNDFCDPNKSDWGYPNKLSYKKVIEIK